MATLTAREIAQRLNASLAGDPSRSVSRIETLDVAGADSLSWLGSMKYASQLGTTRAAVVLIPIECQPPEHCTAILVPDPDLALNEVLGWLYPGPDQLPVGIHATAVIDPFAEIDPTAAVGPHVVIGARARIGANVQLHAGVSVGSGVQIGRDCVLWANVVVRERCILHDRVIIHANATIGADGYGYLQRGGRHIKVPQVGIVEIEDDVEIGANTCIDRAKSGITRIGRGTKIDNLVHVAHNNQIGEGCLILAQAGLSGSCEIGRGVMIGGQVGTIDHLKIGDGAAVHPQSGVMQDVPAGSRVSGAPARDHRDVMRQHVALAKLPKLMEQVRVLERRIERLDKPADDSAGG